MLLLVHPDGENPDLWEAGQTGSNPTDSSSFASLSLRQVPLVGPGLVERQLRRVRVRIGLDRLGLHLLQFDSEVRQYGANVRREVEELHGLGWRKFSTWTKCRY
ncbi:hypothetical protein C1H46_011294 [Malus baccata]|uniref:Uncharacterized protein n=1 Tax=Malus baccata TaxID=106549 RepID=A0A540MXY0_MALBA|nr:hypothetical protein C1H46_011294 [Malus baccata]